MNESNQKPDNNMVWAILTTLFCCLPFGIVSIINASKVDGLYKSGDYEAAAEAAANSKKYAKWGAISGVIVFIIVCIAEVFIIGVADSIDNDDYNEDVTEYVELIEDEEDDEELSISDMRKAIVDDVRVSNNNCPIEVEEGMEITSIRMSGDYIVYEIECDEEVVSISSIKLSKNSVKDAMIESVQENSEDYLNSLRQCGIGMIYKYVGDTSGDVCSIKIESSEF